MNPRIAILALCAAAEPLRGQVSNLIPPHARDSLAAADRRSPSAQRDRQRSLDSLSAGRARWARARVAEYELQVHAECFCVPDPDDSVAPPPLVIVRAGAIVGHARGRATQGYTKYTTIDSLFAAIERDLRDPGRVVRRLDLDPRYGFPREYSAETPEIPDFWLKVHIDSFAVRPASDPIGRRPPPAG